MDDGLREGVEVAEGTGYVMADGEKVGFFEAAMFQFRAKAGLHQLCYYGEVAHGNSTNEEDKLGVSQASSNDVECTGHTLIY